MGCKLAVEGLSIQFEGLMPCNAKNEGKEWPAGFNALYNVFPSQKFMEYWFSVNYYQNTLVFSSPSPQPNNQPVVRMPQEDALQQTLDRVYCIFCNKK